MHKPWPKSGYPKVTRMEEPEGFLEEMSPQIRALPKRVPVNKLTAR